MAEFASNAKGNAALTTGIIGTSLGAINAMGGNVSGILGGLFNGGNGCGTNTAVNRYELSLQNRISELEGEVKLRDANIYTDSKIADTYERLNTKISYLESQICQQNVVNAQITANLSCMQGSINTLMGLTKTIIPIGNVCPSPMPEYNSWTAPTTTTTTGA